MGRGQRLVFLAIAVGIAAVALVMLGESEETTPTTATRTQAPPSETATPAPVEADAQPTPQATPAPPPLLTGAEERELSFQRGDTVRFRVRSATADHVHVHGYDVKKNVPAGRTVTVSFEADIPGVFEVELEESRKPLARLKVTQ